MIDKRISVAVILTVFNRCDITVKGLKSLIEAIAQMGEDYFFDIYLVDDGSTDGTGEAVSKEFPEVTIIKGDGSLYWTGGMYKAWRAAIDSEVEYDFFMWYNDDTILYESAIKDLFRDYNKAGIMSIITGCCCDSYGKGIVTYGGRNNNKLIPPSGVPQMVELMNGNIVLIPNCVVSKVGLLDRNYKHSLGDYDYGLRSRRLGINVMLSSEFVATCDRHDGDLKYCNANIKLWNRLKILYSPRYDVIGQFRFNLHYQSIYTAVGAFLKQNIRALLAINIE